MKKFYFFVLFLSVVVNMPAQIDSRDYPYWNDIVTEQPNGYCIGIDGNIEISSPEGLAWLSNMVNGYNGCEPHSFEGRKIQLITNLPMYGDTCRMRFKPIGNRDHPFMGEFDGKGYSIDKLSLCESGEDKTDLGLFGYLYHAVVRNLVLNDEALYLDPYHKNPDGRSWFSGGVAGISDSLSIVDNCMVASIDGFLAADVVGGVIGMNRNSILKNCAYFSENLLIVPDGGGGGVVGMNVSEGDVFDAIVSNCCFVGEVMPGYTDDFGGIVCYNETAVNNIEKVACVSNCYALSGINLTYAFSGDGFRSFGNEGSIAAVNSQKSMIYNCYGKALSGSHYQLYEVNEGETGNCIGFETNGVSCVLDAPVIINEMETADLLEALNYWIAGQENPSQYRRWKYGVNGLPEYDDPDYDIPETDGLSSASILYPNPTSGTVHIEGESIAEIKVYNTLGQLMKTVQNTNEIDLKGLPKGLYVVKIVDENGFVATDNVVLE